MAAIPRNFVGATGTTYRYERLIQERKHFGRVWVATSGNHRFVLKDIPELIFNHFPEEVQPKLRHNVYLRLPVDTIPDKRIFVFKYLKEDPMSLVRKQIPMHATKRILKDSLRGLTEMHSEGVIHLDIKPDQIMANYHYTGGEMIVEKVQLTDLDNAAYLPNGRYIKSMTAGNENWRSPEAFFKSKINKPTDVFAFGIVCIYVVLRHVILGHNADFQKHEQLGALPDMIRLQRLVSYFVDQEGFEGLMRHLGDDETSRTVLTMLWEDRHEAYILYRSFAEWPEMEDGVFKDLVVRLMNLDPERRITAQETLERLWFEGI